MIFYRHPTPDINLGICYGATDLEIAPVGHSQISAAVSQSSKPYKIIASPAKRCRRLAEALSDHHNVDIAYEPRLWEMNMGKFELVAWNDLPQDEANRWFADPLNEPTPSGESFAQVIERVGEVLDELLQTHHQHHDALAIVCHAGPIRAAQMIWEGKSFKEVFAKAPGYAEPTIIVPPVPRS